MLKIVVVDDEIRIRKGLTKIIERSNEDYQVIHQCEHAIEALEKINAEVDVLITDIRMSGMDGLSLLEEARNRFPRLECIVISGFGNFEYAQQAIRYGIKRYILKPINKDELCEILHQISDTKKSICPQKTSSTNHPIIKKIQYYIYDNYSGKLDLNTLAQHVLLNPTYISKLFKEQTGKNITDFIIQVRIEQAKDLLSGPTSMKTYEIGHVVGYPDPVYFNKIFKKHVGFTPREYQNNTRKSKDNA
ncbi:response regulator [Peribacillus muralis]|uniref:response regulator n=1 Tax=Peribacillus muralis TaxID=264697 RepID=UPI000709A10D|nr:response regulator [Peribacillus muralis]